MSGSRPPIGRRGNRLRASLARRTVRGSEQLELLRIFGAPFADCLGHASWVSAQHCRNSVHRMASPPQRFGCGDSKGLKRLAMYVIAIKDKTCFGVSERGHGLDSIMAAGALGDSNTLGPCGAALVSKLAASLRADDVESSARIICVNEERGSVKPTPTTSRVYGAAGIKRLCPRPSLPSAYGAEFPIIFTNLGEADAFIGLSKIGRVASEKACVDITIQLRHAPTREGAPNISQVLSS